MGIFSLDPEVYARHREEVLRLSNSFQRIGRRGLSDREIAERLGLDERTVTEIRCVAERDCYDLDEWARAIEFKRRACRDWQAAALKRPELREG
ncbi:MAG: response regulator transcription factor [Candidatus Rokubacteria bacterium]|nr:response regulator transcription factor [Candidatus Rokubacteria bacterium]